MKITTRRDNWIKIAKEYYAIKQQKKAIAKREKILLDNLKDISQNKPSQGGGYIFTFSLRKGNVDYQLIPYIKTIDLDKYRKEDIQVWNINFSGE